MPSHYLARRHNNRNGRYHRAAGIIQSAWRNRRQYHQVGKRAVEVYKKWTSGKKAKVGPSSRNAGSFTPAITGSEGHSGLNRTTKKYVRGTKGLKKNEKIAGQLLYRQSYTGKVFPQAGVQSNFELASVGAVSQFTTSSGNTYGVYQNYTCYFDLDPNRKDSGSNLVAAGTIPANAPILARNYAFNIEIANASNIGAYIELYVAMCRQATPYGPVTCWDRGLAADSNGQNIWAPSGPGTGGSGTETPGYATSTYPFIRPSESMVFKKFWKIVESKTINLAPSASEIVNFDVIADKVTRLEAMQNLPSGTIAAANTTYALFMTVRGALVLDKTAQGTTGTVQPAFGGPEIFYHVNCMSKMSNVIGGPAKTRLDRVVSDMGFAQTTANQEVLNEVDVSGPPVLLN